MDAAFEFITKIQAPYFCFHDFDLIEEGHSLVESEKRLQFIGDYAKEKMAASGVKVLWGTANLFSHPRYMNGAATNPDFSVVAYAAAQVKHALDISMGKLLLSKFTGDEVSKFKSKRIYQSEKRKAYMGAM
jgi:xylose isomerase